MTTRMFTRREATGLIAGTVGALGAGIGLRAQKPDSRVSGVRIGAQSYSFRGLSLDATMAAMASVGLSYCELWQGQVETRDAIGAVSGAAPAPPVAPPAGTAATAGRRGGGASPEARAAQREALRRWRLEVPLDYFRDIRRRFESAGITLTAYNLSFQNDFTDAEFDRGFEMAKALGVDVITASSKVSTAAKVAPFAKKHGITVAFHNHSRVSPDEFATPADFETALAAAPDRLAVNLDVGHFNGAGFDALPYLEQHHARIVSLHLKDKKREGDQNVPWGEGDTPIREVLRLLRDRRWDIPAQIEYEYRGAEATTEVRRCYDFCRQALLA